MARCCHAFSRLQWRNPIGKKRIYHSGGNRRCPLFSELVKRAIYEQPTAAVGYSLGGNMLAYYLAESGENAVLDAAVISVSTFDVRNLAQPK